jgi:hypothetical protein
VNLAHFAALVLALNALAYRVRADLFYASAIELFATALWVLALYAAWLDSQARLRAADQLSLARRAVRRVVRAELAAVPFRSRAENDQNQVITLAEKRAA